MVPEFEPALVEAAVLAALPGRPEARALHAERDPLYALADPEAREPAFSALHARWFERLGLHRPLLVALAERPGIEAGCARAIVARAPASRAEGADLLVSPPDPPTLLLRLTPATLSRPEQALALLRHELLHVADMLDPDFGYEPRLSSAEDTALLDPGRAERYRVLRDAYVDGRLVRAGRAPAARRAERRREFTQAFPALSAGAEAAFARFFDAPRCTHAELVAFASAGGAERRAQEALAGRPDTAAQAEEVG
jgi:hypothetical protein